MIFSNFVGFLRLGILNLYGTVHKRRWKNFPFFDSLHISTAEYCQNGNYDIKIDLKKDVLNTYLILNAIKARYVIVKLKHWI